MARSASPSNASSPSSSWRYLSWDEVAVFNGSGSKEIHYFLKRLDGRADLAVVGRERTSFRMSYRCVLRRKSTAVVGKLGTVMKKFETRDEVIVWLNSITSGLLPREHLLDGKVVQSFKHLVQDTQFAKSCTSKDFSWVGSPWTCSNMLRHYPSYRRHGIKISVNSFVYVLAEENKRLVAYIEDLYEDSRCNRMAMVQWFHKVGEVGSPFPRNHSDREIFFSLSLQDLSVECIDGLATVVSPHHFEKYTSAVVSNLLEIFICQCLFEDDEIKPFDVTRVKGYWNQELIRHIFSFPPPKAPMKPRQFDASKEMEQSAADDTADCTRPRKKQRRLESDLEQQPYMEELSTPNQLNMEAKENPPQQLCVGCEVEVLCQDSGIRGCWFRASIIKMLKDKAKVRYQDIQDAVDEAKNLEEWVSLSKVAASDEYGLWAIGRKAVRPSLRCAQSKSLSPIGVGTAVDVWRYDGWWEGIVVQGRDKGTFSVYFPGVKQESVFPLEDLRVSHNWFEGKWIHVLQRPDVAKIVSSVQNNEKSMDQLNNAPSPRTSPDSELPTKEDEVACEEHGDGLLNDAEEGRDLAKLKWKSFRKRSCRRSSVQKKVNYKNRDHSSLKRRIEVGGGTSWRRGNRIIMPLMVDDTEKCKFMGESPVVPPPTNLVMSR